MATQIENDSDVSVATLVGGIVQDARKLLVEQMTLFQVEVKNDIRRTTSALMPLIAGLGVILSGVVLLGIAGANFIVWADPELPFWLAYAIIGGIFAVAGGALVFVAKSMLNSVHSTPDTALKGLKENIQWKTKN